MGQASVHHSKKLLSKKLLNAKKPNWWKGSLMSWFRLSPLCRKSYGKTVNAVYIKKKWCISISQHRPFSSRLSNGGEGIETIRQLPCLLDITRADFNFIWRVKLELADFSLSQGRFKMSLVGVTWTITKDEFAVATRWWMNRCEKYVPKNGLWPGLKSPEIREFLNNGICIIVISPCAFDFDGTL